jgi:poly(beta-D-mannuronate) lyase
VHSSFLSRPFPATAFLALILGLSTTAIHAAEPHVVDSLAKLKSAINRAAPGDTILLKDGVYSTTGPITIKCFGAPGKPITIAAENDGGVELAGTHGFTVSEPAEHIVIYGFKFTHASGKNSIGVGTRHVRFTHNIFQCTGDGPYLSVLGDDAQVDGNEFAEKKSAGSMLAVGGTGNQVARRLWVHHNYFHDYTSTLTGTAEMIRFGLSALSLSTGQGLVEHNLFVRCRGESDLISNRSSGNTYRYNTFLDSPTSKLSLRHGNDCAVYGNVFRNTEGLRLFGDRHQVFSNYFEGNYTAIAIGNGNVEVAEGGDILSFDRPDDCVIAFNTFVENRTHLQMSRRAAGALGARNLTVAQNLFSGGGTAARIEGPLTGASWSGNLVWTKGGSGDIPADGFTKADPLLENGPGDIKRPRAGSPAIDTATGSFPLVTVDLDGQPRTAPLDKGADEISTAPVIARVLAPADVGPGVK